MSRPVLALTPALDTRAPRPGPQHREFALPVSRLAVYSVIPKMSILTGGRLRTGTTPGSASWTITEAGEMYDVPRWGQGYFSINEHGHLQVHPTKEPGRSVDLKRLVDRLQLRGLAVPILLRFTDILKHRLGEIHAAFQQASAQHQYQGRYRCVYPIKVNQQRQVVEEVLNFGAQYGFGLEAGSKPELLAVAALATNDTPIICNGFKDYEFIEMAMLAQKMGRQIIPVVEKYTELELILEYAEKVGVRPNIGMRVKLAARGSGRWQSSGGFRSKFGLTVTEILRGFEELKRRGMEDCFKLLHFHLGSQITHIRIIKNALNEAARVYCELAKQGAGLQFIDVGGGLGVDYDGSQTNFESSMNYTLQEYANDVVYHIQTVCDEEGVRHPTIVSESGRAVSAYHSMLVFNVLGTTGFGEEQIPEKARDDFEQPLVDLLETYQSVTQRNAVESYHDAQQALDMAMNLFSGGYLSLEQRAHAENVFWAICEKINKLCKGMDDVPEDLQALEEMLSDTYFCNFSLFQSIPDSWAIKQLFPVMPIHRLNEAPGESRRHRRHHLRLRRQAGSVHRSPRRQEDGAAAPVQRRARTTWACSWSGRIRKSSATSTTCSATPTPSMSTSPTTATRAPTARASSTSSRATRSARC